MSLRVQNARIVAARSFAEATVVVPGVKSLALGMYVRAYVRTRVHTHVRTYRDVHTYVCMYIPVFFAR